ncbi:hypothetical protein GCM10010430_31270 [Kitasatospora cystarginea]|uniref:Uncharacterized protein n=1 Tax=Kitasatospora cystarginea TaxID=58350 RepID=A0ABP5QXV7_9ACTN
MRSAVSYTESASPPVAGAASGGLLNSRTVPPIPSSIALILVCRPGRAPGPWPGPAGPACGGSAKLPDRRCAAQGCDGAESDPAHAKVCGAALATRTECMQPGKTGGLR